MIVRKTRTSHATSDAHAAAHTTMGAMAGGGASLPHLSLASRFPFISRISECRVSNRSRILSARLSSCRMRRKVSIVRGEQTFTSKA